MLRLLAVAFIVMKVAGIINWSWLAVLSPVFAIVVLCVIEVLIALWRWI